MSASHPTIAESLERLKKIRDTAKAAERSRFREALRNQAAEAAGFARQRLFNCAAIKQEAYEEVLALLDEPGCEPCLSPARDAADLWRSSRARGGGL